MGPTIRLLTLKQLVENKSPFPVGFYSQELQVVRYDQLVGLQMEYQHLVPSDPNGNNELPNPFDKVFRVEGNKAGLLSTCIPLNFIENSMLKSKQN